MLRVQNLTKWWGDFRALDSVSFEVGKGEVVGFLGPNGAGKTTTMRIITGFIPPSSGLVTVDGVDVFTDSLAVRRAIGYLPENTPIYPDLRVGEYLRFRAQLKGVPRRERAAQVGRALERCRIVDVERKLVGVLSKGYRQRVGLADALLGKPSLLVLDEPTAGMDPNQVREVRKLVKELGEDHTILLSTHILPEVEATCSRVLIIAGGRIVAQDEVAALRQGELAAAAVHVEALAPAEATEAALRAVPGVRAVTRVPEVTGEAVGFRVEGEGDLREAIARAALEQKIPLREVRSQAKSLEDIFVRYTAGERRVDAEAAELPPLDADERLRLFGLLGSVALALALALQLLGGRGAPVAGAGLTGGDGLETASLVLRIAFFLAAAASFGLALVQHLSARRAS